MAISRSRNNFGTFLKVVRYAVVLVFVLATQACGAGDKRPPADIPREQMTVPFQGEDIKVRILGMKGPADLEKHFKQPSRLYFVKLLYRDNYYSFNVPEEIFDQLQPDQKRQMVSYFLGLYNRVFDVFAGIFGRVPEWYRFNITFGKTASGMPYNKVYTVSKTSNIFPDSLPFSDGRNVLTEKERVIMLHEIGHSLFAISVGNYTHPKTKAIEEGFVDYIAEKVEGKEGAGTESAPRLVITAEQAERMKGLSQLDVEISIWGREAVLNASKVEGYVGLTHHVFGIEFIKAFIDVFGGKDLPVFLKRLKVADEEPSEGGFGTGQIMKILKKMGYSGEKIAEFEKELHTRLMENVFTT